MRELGRTGEALAAYEDTIARFPDNVFGRIGRASILADLGRFEEAREALGAIADEPRTQSDWVAHHIICTINLRRGVDTALADRMQHLVATCPYPAHRRFFETTLAMVRLKLRRTAEARSSLEALVVRPGVGPSEQAALHLMKAHAEAADGDLNAARRSLETAAIVVPYEEFRARQIRREIERRFGLGGKAALTQPAEIASADATLVELEAAFVTARMSRLGSESRRAA